MGELREQVEGTAAARNGSASRLQAKKKMPRDTEKGRYCQNCGRWMWAMDLSADEFLWHCPNCRESLRSDGTKVSWYQPRKDIARMNSNERKYQGAEPCPRCGRSMLVVDIPEYGSRKQCESCRISVVPGGAILEWRTRAPRAGD
jgi:ribosomal protein S14